MNQSALSDASQARHAILHAKNLAVGYRRSEPILRGIQATYVPRNPRKQVLGFVGPNGTGKTTLLKTCIGLLSPLAGELRLLGVDTKKAEFANIRRSIAYIPQTRPEGTAGRLRISVREAVSFGRLGKHGLRGRFHRTDREAIDAAIAYCGLESLADKAVQDISGGQFQRVSIARAMAAEPRLYLFDEPDSYLDQEGQSAVRSLIVSLAESGVPLIIVTHDRGLQELCDSFFFFNSGTATLLDANELHTGIEGFAP